MLYIPISVELHGGSGSQHLLRWNLIVSSGTKNFYRVNAIHFLAFLWSDHRPPTNRPKKESLFVINPIVELF